MTTRSFVSLAVQLTSKRQLLFPLLVVLVPACGDPAADDDQDESGVTAGDPTATSSQGGPAMPSAAMPTAPLPASSPMAMASGPTPATASNPPAVEGPTPTPMTPVSSAPMVPTTPAPDGTGGSPTADGASPPMGSAGDANAGSPSMGGANTGGTSGAAGGMTDGGAGGTVGPGDFTLSSDDYADGEMIPDEFTCEGKAFGEGISPHLAWTGAPPGTMSFALTFIDVTLTERVPPDMNGYHWAMWDIPASTVSLPQGLAEGATLTDPAGAKQYSPLSPVYLGPCPSFGQMNMDTYEFTLYALDVEMLTEPPNNVAQLEQLFLDHAIATATISGWSDAAPQ